MSRRHHLATAAALAALSPLAFAISPAVAARKARPRAAATARFEIIRVDIRGEHVSRLVDDNTVYDYRGIASYETSVDEQGMVVVPPPARRRLPRALVVRSLEYNGLSDATIRTSSGVYDCSWEVVDPWVPEGFTALVAFTRTHMLVNWLLMSPGIRCPPEALVWTVPPAPSRAMLQRYKLAPLLKVKRNRTTRLPIRIDHRWDDVDGDHRVRWRGWVLVQRIR